MKLILRQIKRKVQDLIFFLLKKLPIDSEYLGPPKKYWISTYSWFINLDKNHHLVKYYEISGEHLLERMSPNNIDGYIDWRFDEWGGYLGKTFIAPPTFVVKIPLGRIYGPNGTVISPDDCLLADVSVEFGVLPEVADKHSVFRHIKLPELKKSMKTAAVLSAVGGSNYFHWMFDILPRLGLLEQANQIENIDYFLCNHVSHSFQKETLSILDIPEDKILSPDKDFYCQYGTLIVPSLIGITGSVTKQQCDFLREKFLPSFNTASHRKLYISRQDATTRKIVNEDLLITFLEKLNFEVVSMSGLSVIEQATLFQEAQIIVAPHGASLTNLVFCNSTCKILELFSPTYVNPCYRALSNLVGVEYWYLLGQGDVLAESSPLHLSSGICDDILISINNVQRTLEAMINRVSESI